MNTREDITVLDESILDDELHCWAGGHGAEVRVVLICCDKEAFGCTGHYLKWRAAWERLAEVHMHVECSSCKARFDRVGDAIHVHLV